MHSAKKNLGYEDFLRTSAAMREREIAVATIPNPGDFFGVVVSGAGIVVAVVWGSEVVGMGDAVVITAVVGLVVSDVVVTVVGTNIT